MVEVLLTIILIPIALTALVFTGALVVGIGKTFFKKKK